MESTLSPGLSIRRVPISSLRPDPANARTHDARNLDAIRSSLATFTQVEPLVTQRSTGRVIGGHGRLEAMRTLGWTECDVVELDIDDVRATGLAIALNRTSELASWDLPTLGRILESLDDADALEGVGFSPEEMQDLLDDIASTELTDVTEDIAPAPPDAATSKRGDLWILGEHRLLVGDSAERADVERLLNGARIQCVNSDPPYGVRVEPRSNNAIASGMRSFAGSTHHQKLDVERHPTKAQPTHNKLRAKDRPLANDFLPDAEFAVLLRKWFGNFAYALEPGRAFFIWGGYGNLGNYPPALAECGLYFSQGIVWNKMHPVLTRKDFLGCYELAFYGWREGAAHVFLGPNNAPDLWDIKKVNPQSMVHLTEKPVALAARAIEYGSRVGENVLDLFGGSGSTLVACEQLDRHAYLVELDELYADVIVARWQQLTGQKATLDGDGRSYEELQVVRRTP